MTNARRRKKQSARSDEADQPKKRNKASRGTVIAEVHRALSKLERRRSIQAAREEFDHHKEHLHDREIKDGAADALVRMLCLVLRKPHKERAGESEIGNICKCLTFIFCRCRDAAAAVAFRADVDGISVIALLRVLKMAMNGGILNDDGLAAESVLLILDRFARTRDEAVISSMANNADLVGTMVNVLNAEQQMDKKARTEALAVLVHILNTKNLVDNATIGGHVGLIHSFGNAAKNMSQAELSSTHSRYLIALGSAYFNLTLSKDNRRRMAENEVCLQGLLALLTLTTDPSVKKLAASTVENISCNCELNVRMLVRHDDGAFLQGLVGILCSDDYHYSAAEDAASSLANMAEFDEARRLMALDNHILELLCGLVAKPFRSLIHGPAVCLLGKLMEYMSHNNLLDTIQLCSGFKKWYGYLTFGMFRRSRDKERAEKDFACNEVFTFLVKVLQTKGIEEDARRFAVSVLRHFAVDDDIAETMSRNQGVVRVLTDCALKAKSDDFCVNDKDWFAPQEAAETLAWIVHECVDTAQLAKTKDLRDALQNYAMLAVEMVQRDDAERALRMLDLAEGSLVVSP